jgi:hypothetical protein
MAWSIIVGVLCALSFGAGLIIGPFMGFNDRTLRK